MSGLDILSMTTRALSKIHWKLPGYMFRHKLTPDYSGRVISKDLPRLESRVWPEYQRKIHEWKASHDDLWETVCSEPSRQTLRDKHKMHPNGLNISREIRTQAGVSDEAQEFTREEAQRIVEAIMRHHRDMF